MAGMVADLTDPFSLLGLPTDYLAPTSLDDLFRHYSGTENGDILLAGGQSIIPALLNGSRSARRIIDLRAIAQLQHIHCDDETISLGAMVSFDAILRSEAVLRCPVLRKALSYVGTTTIRNRATVGGSLAWADPRAELPLVLMLLDATIETDRRRLQMSALPQAAFATRLEPGEIIIAVHISRKMWGGPVNFAELLDRHSAGKAIVSVGMMQMIDGLVRVAVGGLFKRPLVVEMMEKDIEEWFKIQAGEQDMLADPFHSIGYRQKMAAILFRRLQAGEA